jgi:hypothetical protein
MILRGLLLWRRHELRPDRFAHRLANDVVYFDERVGVKAPAHNVGQGVEVARSAGSPECDRYTRLFEYPSDRQPEDRFAIPFASECRKSSHGFDVLRKPWW